jgi:hypothetical protein
VEQTPKAGDVRLAAYSVRREREGECGAVRAARPSCRRLKCWSPPTAAVAWKARLAADRRASLLRVWAENQAEEERQAPDSSCAWLSFLVDIDRVSNNCGGDWGEVGRWAQNTMGNTSSFTDPDTGWSYTVNFADACDLHDAGYGGYTVVDTINGGTVDYHNWNRERVDKKFRKDMQEL